MLMCVHRRQGLCPVFPLDLRGGGVINIWVRWVSEGGKEQRNAPFWHVAKGLMI